MKHEILPVVKATSKKVTTLRKKFAKNLKATRKLQNISQEVLAEKLDINVRYIQQLEGKNTPNIKLDTLEKLAKALALKPFELLQ